MDQDTREFRADDLGYDLADCECPYCARKRRNARHTRSKVHARKPCCELAEQILRRAGAPMRLRDIIQAGGDEWPTTSRSPDRVVARDLAIDVRDNPHTVFERIDAGLYRIRDGESALTHPANAECAP